MSAPWPPPPTQPRFAKFLDAMGDILMGLIFIELATAILAHAKAATRAEWLIAGAMLSTAFTLAIVGYVRGKIRE